MLEPQLQYTWHGLSLDDGQDNAGYLKFGYRSAQPVTYTHLTLQTILLV